MGNDEGVAPLNHPRTTRAHLTCLAALKAGFYVALSMPFKVSAAQVDARVPPTFPSFPTERPLWLHKISSFAPMPYTKNEGCLCIFKQINTWLISDSKLQ